MALIGKRFLKAPHPEIEGDWNMVAVNAERLTPTVINQIWKTGRDKMGYQTYVVDTGVEALIKNVVDVSGLLAVLESVGSDIRSSLSQQDNGDIVAVNVMEHIDNLRTVFKELGDARPDVALEAFNDVMYGLMSGLARVADHLNVAETTAECHQAEARFFEQTAKDAGEVFDRDARELAAAAAEFLESVADIEGLEFELKACGTQLKMEAGERRKTLQPEHPELVALSVACEKFTSAFSIGQGMPDDIAQAETSLRETATQIEKAEQALATAQAEYRHVCTCAQSRARDLETQFDQVFPRLKSRRASLAQWKERLDREDVNLQAMPVERGLIAADCFKRALDLVGDQQWKPFRVNERVRTLIGDCHTDYGKGLVMPEGVQTSMRWARLTCDDLAKRLGIKLRGQTTSKEEKAKAAALRPVAAPLSPPVAATTATVTVLPAAVASEP